MRKPVINGTDLLRQADKSLASAIDAQMESLDADEVELTSKRVFPI
jgi:hypothetical protein